MNPFLFNQAKQNMGNMTPDNMRMAADMMKNMSESEIQNLMRMTGMNISPDLLKSSANMMAGMSDKDINNLKNNIPGNQQFPGPQANASNSEKEKEKEKETPTATFPKIEKLKTQGNDFFKKSLFDQASSSYLEAILEIDELKMQGQKYNKEELTQLEIACRLNYANVKAKLEEYDIVLKQANEVLKFGSNGKAYFRKGQALYHLNKYKEALESLETATTLLPQDTVVSNYLQKTRQSLREVNKEGDQNKTAPSNTTSDGEAKVRKEEKQTKESKAESQNVEKEIKSEPKTERVEKEKSKPVQEPTEKKQEEKPQPQVPKEKFVPESAEKQPTHASTTSASPASSTAKPAQAEPKAHEQEQKKAEPNAHEQEKNKAAPKPRDRSKSLVFALVYALLIIGVYVFKRMF